MRLLRMFSVLLIGAYCSAAAAGAFKVYPLKLELAGNAKTGVLRLSNTGTGAVTIQLEARRWFQTPAGEDGYDTTTDLVFFPKIVTIQQGDHAIVRLAYRGASPRRSEGTYRLFAQEIPTDKDTPLQLALRFGIPVFLRPGVENSANEIQKLILADGTVRVTVANRGNRHFMVGHVEVQGMDKSQQNVFSRSTGGWYVLPGAARTFSVDLPVADCLRSEELRIQAKVGQGVKVASLPVEPGGCREEAQENVADGGKP